MMDVIRQIDDLAARRGAANFLAAPWSEDTVNIRLAGLKPFKPTQELLELYCWKNGTKEELFPIPYEFGFLPWRDAMQSYKDIQELNHHLSPEYRMSLVPLNFCADGYFVAQVFREEKARSPLYRLSHSGDLSKIHNSIESYFAYLVELLATTNTLSARDNPDAEVHRLPCTEPEQFEL